VFDSVFPIISTPDMQEALGFYRDLLGGTVLYQFPPEGEADYIGIDIGSTHIGLGRDPEVSTGTAQRFSLWVYTDDCDAAIERLREGGTTIIDEPADQPWGERVARVHDPDGNVVFVGQRAN
jgi:lactoylglutathione lyase